MKFLVLVVVLTLFLSFLPAFVYAQEMNHHDDLEKLLEYEDTSQFFTNQNSGDFQKNFVRTATLSPSNNILIKSGTTITLTGLIDREYSTVLVEGNLKIIDTGDSSLRVQKIIVGPTGSLTIGNEKKPIQSDDEVEIVLVNNNKGEVGIFVFGNLWIHGKEITPTFVGLESFAKKWEKRITVNTELENWERDDTIIVTSLGNEPCNEIIQISKVTHKVINLQSQLNCSHVGSDDENPITSHIALLSRNVKITSEDEVKRGSVNFFHGSNGYIKYAEFDKLGPKEVLGRYPIHFHHLKDTSRGIEVIGNSITNSDNRWITIHDSNGILVKNNVGYISQGHGFFLEDGNEFDNIFENNIGIITKAELILDSSSSVFWTMNPQNEYRNNVAVNGHYWGFSFDVPDSSIINPTTEEKINLRSLPSLEFEGNVAYNFRHGGMKILRPLNLQNSNSSSEIIISNFHAKASEINFENHFGILVAGSNVLIFNSTIENNKIGIQLSGNKNSVFETKITMERNALPEKDISGILIAGRDNWIENSEIKGYISKNNNDGSDIQVSNNQKLKGLLSAKIINTTLFDPVPIYFGNPANENSFLEIFGYDAPFAQTEKLPQNFLVKKIGSETIEARGEYNNLIFDGMIKLLTDTNPEKKLNNDDEKMNNFDNSENELITSFKNKSNDWKNGKLSNKEFINEIEIIFESRLIQINGVEEGYFQESDFLIPQWIKKLVNFWFKNSITDKEFLNAIEYVLQSQKNVNLKY